VLTSSGFRGSSAESGRHIRDFDILVSVDALRDIVPGILKIHNEDDDFFIITYAFFLVHAATKHDRMMQSMAATNIIRRDGSFPRYRGLYTTDVLVATNSPCDQALILNNVFLFH
jgi:hypothetical protein